MLELDFTDDAFSPVALVTNKKLIANPDVINPSCFSNTKTMTLYQRNAQLVQVNQKMCAKISYITVESMFIKYWLVSRPIFILFVMTFRPRSENLILSIFDNCSTTFQTKIDGDFSFK